jgi:DNA-binding NarL/FixJ family response regulator
MSAPGQRTLSLIRGTASPKPGRREGFSGGMIMIRVLLAEDQAMVRGALSALLSREKDIEVVAEVARGDEVVKTALETQPDVALLDIEMPGGDGLTAAQALQNALPTCRSVILTTFGRSGYLRRAMESGAVGFLLKDAPASELAIALRRVMAGERVVDPDLALAAKCLPPRSSEPVSRRLPHDLSSQRGPFGTIFQRPCRSWARRIGWKRHEMLSRKDGCDVNGVRGFKGSIQK